MDHELSIVSEAIKRAGHEALRLAAVGFDTYTKPDQSPVTSVDLAVNQILRDHLSAAFPEDGWLSEETEDNHHRLTRSRVWIVDPIDGTRSFVRGLPEFCLSVALVEQGIRNLAQVGNPFHLYQCLELPGLDARQPDGRIVWLRLPALAISQEAAFVRL